VPLIQCPWGHEAVAPAGGRGRAYAAVVAARGADGVLSPTYVRSRERPETSVYRDHELGGDPTGLKARESAHPTKRVSASRGQL
jgi:hypothetical protein